MFIFRCFWTRGEAGKEAKSVSCKIDSLPLITRPYSPDHTRNYTTRLSHVRQGRILQVFILFARMAYFTQCDILTKNSILLEILRY